MKADDVNPYTKPDTMKTWIHICIFCPINWFEPQVELQPIKSEVVLTLGLSLYDQTGNYTPVGKTLDGWPLRISSSPVNLSRMQMIGCIVCQLSLHIRQQGKTKKIHPWSLFLLMRNIQGRCDKVTFSSARLKYKNRCTFLFVQMSH